MKFIRKSANGYELDRYFAYLTANRAKLPPNALEFAEAPWHYKIDDSRCPHDSWVEALSIIEPATGSRQEIRRLEILVRLLGAYHDGHIELRYLDVTSYSLLHDRGHALQRSSIAHDDWLIDEVLHRDDGSVTHEIAFASGAVWNIGCADIIYRWLPDK